MAKVNKKSNTTKEIPPFLFGRIRLFVYFCHQLCYKRKSNEIVFLIQINNMKKLIVFILFGILGFLPVFSQETKTFQILKIKKLKNDCYCLTARNNGKKYTIYSHCDEDGNYGEKIKCLENLELKIFPFSKTEQVPLAKLKELTGMPVTPEDSARYVDVPSPLNYLDIKIDYYGNILKRNKERMYYTPDLNGLYKRQK